MNNLLLFTCRSKACSVIAFPGSFASCHSLYILADAQIQLFLIWSTILYNCLLKSIMSSKVLFTGCGFYIHVCIAGCIFKTGN